MDKRQRFAAGFTLAELVVCTAIAGMMFVFAAPALDKGRASSEQRSCENNLRRLSQAHLAYANAHGGLPPMALSVTHEDYMAVQPGSGSWFDGHGWYTLVGPFIGEDAWASTIDFTVSLSAAKNFAARRGGLALKIHACPADVGMQRHEWNSNSWARVSSNYVVNAGNTNYGQTTLNGVPFLGAPFALARITTVASITDGLSNTLLMSEVIVLPETLGVWGGPYSETQPAGGGQTFTGYYAPNGNNHDGIGYGRNGNQGSVQGDALYLKMGFTPGNWPVEVFTGIGSLGTHIAPRSRHPGGVNASLCDGSAGFIANSIDPAVWRALSSAQGNEALPMAAASASIKSK